MTQSMRVQNRPTEGLGQDKPRLSFAKEIASYFSAALEQTLGNTAENGREFLDGSRFDPASGQDIPRRHKRNPERQPLDRRVSKKWRGSMLGSGLAAAGDCKGVADILQAAERVIPSQSPTEPLSQPTEGPESTSAKRDRGSKAFARPSKSPETPMALCLQPDKPSYSTQSREEEQAHRKARPTQAPAAQQPAKQPNLQMRPSKRRGQPSNQAVLDCLERFFPPVESFGRTGAGGNLGHLNQPSFQQYKAVLGHMEQPREASDAPVQPARHSRNPEQASEFLEPVGQTPSPEEKDLNAQQEASEAEGLGCRVSDAGSPADADREERKDQTALTAPLEATCQPGVALAEARDHGGTSERCGGEALQAEGSQEPRDAPRRPAKKARGSAGWGSDKRPKPRVAKHQKRSCTPAAPATPPQVAVPIFGHVGTKIIPSLTQVCPPRPTEAETTSAKKAHFYPSKDAQGKPQWGPGSGKPPLPLRRRAEIPKPVCFFPRKPEEEASNTASENRTSDDDKEARDQAGEEGALVPISDEEPCVHVLEDSSEEPDVERDASLERALRGIPDEVEEVFEASPKGYPPKPAGLRVEGRRFVPETLLAALGLPCPAKDPKKHRRKRRQDSLGQFKEKQSNGVRPTRQNVSSRPDSAHGEIEAPSLQAEGSTQSAGDIGTTPQGT